MIRQTAAVFVDAYRAMRAGKIFWVVLGISALMVAVFAAIGVTDRGLRVLWWDLALPIAIPADLFYQQMVFQIGFKVWLTWGAAILALISVAGLFPDFMSGGAIELTLSKPIGRLRLFLTKYLAGLMFIGAQTLVFAGGVFLVLGLRAGIWSWWVVGSLPLVLLFFSYLYCVCAAIGVATRSTLTALLGTILVWLAIFLVHTSETAVLLFSVNADQRASLAQAAVDRREEERRTLSAEREALVAAEDGDETATAARETRLAKIDARLETLEEQLAVRTPRLEDERRKARTLGRVHALMFALKTVLPKTAETMDLVPRYMLSESERGMLLDAGAPPDAGGLMPERDPEMRVSMRSVQGEVDRRMRSRTEWWVLGSSLGFELAVLAIAGWVFCRRDF